MNQCPYCLRDHWPHCPTGEDHPSAAEFGAVLAQSTRPLTPKTSGGIPHAAVRALAQALWDDDADRSGTPESPVEEYDADALRMLAPTAQIIAEHLAHLVEQGCPMPDAPPDHECGYRKSATIVRDAFKEEPRV